MKTGRHHSRGGRGSVLIIVIWVCLGLVALTLYFADQMTAEMRAADNRSADVEARQAVAAGTRYAALLLGQVATGGTVPRPEDYVAEALPVGEATFWFIGRNPDVEPTSEPVFGLIDESSKLNLNSASQSMLEGLPGMTPDLAQAIIAWRNRTTDAGGADGSTYSRLDPPRLNKSAPFESVDELRLVYGATLELLFGEDTNRNGALDPAEDDGEGSSPRDDQNGRLLAGITEFVTVHSRLPGRRADGSGQRVNITSPQTRQALPGLLQRRLDAGRAAEVLRLVGNREFRSVLEFMWDSGLSSEEYVLLRGDLSHRTGNSTGLVNVNTASETVLACLPGIGPDYAAAIIAYRAAHPDALTSFAWLRDVLPRSAAVAAGPFLTDQSYQFSADVAAVGRRGRGYARARTVFDLGTGTPRIVQHQDLSACGWALGGSVRQSSRSPRDT